MVTSPSSLNPPTDRRSISIDDYQPSSPPPQSSSSESDNDENDTPTPLPTRPPRRRPPRKSASSISLDSLDRDELPDETVPPQPSQPPQHPQHPQSPKQQSPRSTLDPPPGKQPLNNNKELVKDKLPMPESATPVTPSPEMDLDAPLTDDNLVNIAALPANDDFAWDRFIFFSYRSQRFEFPKDCYLSSFSPFAAVASAMVGLTTRSVCAVCGAGGSTYSCIRCPLAFHQSCIDPLKTTSVNASTPWMCPACKAAKNGDISPDWFPAPGREPPPLPDPSTGLKRLIADAREGNPLDMVLHPSLFKYYKDTAGADWLRCVRCQRIRVVRDGVLSEAVQIPFECAHAFWVDAASRRCEPQGNPKHLDKNVMRIEQYIRSRKTQRQLLFRFGFGEEDAPDYGRPDMNNLPVLRPVQLLHPQATPSSVSPMEISPATVPEAPSSQQGLAQSMQPIKPVVAERPQPQPQVEVLSQQSPPPRQVISSAAQQVQPQVGSASVTPQSSPHSRSHAGSGMTPVRTAVVSSIQQSPSMSATTSDPSRAGAPKAEPLENDQNNQQDLLTFIASLDWEEWLEDALTDLALANNKQLIQLYGALHSAPAKFQRQATRLAQRMKGDMRPQPQSAAQPQVQAQPQPPPMQMHMPVQPQQSLRVQQSLRPQQPPQQMHIQQAAPQRLHQTAVDTMYRQMAIRHVREMQELEQQFMRRMEQVPVAQVAELMNMKDATVAGLKQRQQEETRRFYQTHGMR